jgi:hypothetical protein
MVFNLKSNKDLGLTLVLLFIFNLIEYLLPSRITSISAYVVGALSFISIIEICQYFIKPYTPKKSRHFTFVIFIIILLLLFHITDSFFSKAYIYGTYAGCIIAIVLKVSKLLNRGD